MDLKVRFPSSSMTITQVFFRVWRAVSFPLAGITLLICYLSLPDQVSIQFDEAGRPIKMINKQEWFYWIAGIIVFINLMMAAFEKSFGKLLPNVVSKTLSWSKAPLATKKLAEGWVHGLTGSLNTFVMLSTIGLFKANEKEGQLLTINLNWLMILGVVMFMLTLFYLPIQLLFSSPAEGEE